MARGYGSSSSSSSGCAYCNSPLSLFGFHWENSKINGFFAIQIIAIIALLICLGLSVKFKWTRPTGARDTPRTTLYIVTSVFYILFFIISVVNTGLAESNTETINLYMLVYIFQNLFWRMGELLSLAVVLRTVIGNTASRTFHKLSVLNSISVAVVGMLTIAQLGLYISNIVDILRTGVSHYGDGMGVDLYKISLKIYFGYAAVYLLTTIYAAAIGFIVLVKEHSLATFLTSLLVVPAILLRILIDLATNAVYYATAYGKMDATTSTINLQWADNYFYVISTIAIMVGVAVVGILRPKDTTVAYESQHQKNIGYEHGAQVPVYH